MNDTDIRSWARENGVDLSSRGPVPRRVRDQYAEATGAVEAVEFEGEHSAPVILDTGESPPVIAPKPTPAGKMRSVLRRRKDLDAPAGPRRKRTSTAGVLSGSWIGLANLVARSGFEPVGICMSFQSPVAGELIEQATKGTVVDRMIQPLARTSERSKILGALIGPPLIVAAIQQRPALFDQLAPVLESCLYTWVEVGGPVAVKKAQARAKREAEYGEDVQAMMQAIFAPLVKAAQQAAEAATPTTPDGQPTAKPKRGPNGKFTKEKAGV